MQCDTVRCSVVQCDSEHVAVCCSITLFHCSQVLFVFGRVSVLQCVAVVCCSVLQCAAVCCSVLQCAAVCCSVTVSMLQCVAVLLCSTAPKFCLSLSKRVCCSVLLQCVVAIWCSAAV